MTPTTPISSFPSHFERIYAKSPLGRDKEVPLRGDSEGGISSLWNNAPQNLSIRLEEKFGSVTPLSLHSLIELAPDALLMSSVKNSGNLAVQGWQGSGKKP
jgi:hypothetical protein